MDLAQVKDIATVAAPLVKLLIDEFISPKVKQLIKSKGVSIQMTAHSFENQFSSCLLESYSNFSTPNILVLRNQQRLLKDIYVPLEVIRESKDKERHIINDFKKDFIPQHKKVLIVDTAGMGKSTISKRLFLAIVEQRVGVPVLIELRKLKKDKKIIDEIFRQLSMVNEKANEDFVLELIRKGGFVFMLDGFDEIEHEERKHVVEDIRNFIEKASKNYFLLTSRREDALGAFGDFMSFKIRSLHIEEAYTLLRNYDNNGEISNLLIREINKKKNKDVKEFLQNPLLVSLLYAAFDYKHTIPLKKYMFYRQVYDAFFETHDLTKGESFTRNKYTKLESDDFHRVLRHIGYHCMMINKLEFTKDELLKVVEQAKLLCIDLKFAASDFLKDLLTKVPLFMQDGLYIRWTHKSIQEYFAANFIYHDAKSKQGPILMALAKSDDNRYFNVLDIYSSIDPKSFRRYIVYTALVKYLEYIIVLRNIWPDISDATATIMFSQKFMFTRYDSSEVLSDSENSKNIISKLGPYISDEWLLIERFYNNEKRRSFVKVFHTSQPYFVVFALLRSGKFDFLKHHDGRAVLEKDGKKIYSSSPTSTYSFLKINDGEIFILDGSSSDELFLRQDINALINSFNFNYAYVDEKKALDFVKEVEKEIAYEQLDDFLMFGLEP